MNASDGLEIMAKIIARDIMENYSDCESATNKQTGSETMTKQDAYGKQASIPK